MKKTISLFLLLLVCSWASADSLERFVDRYKDKGGAVYKVINANSKLDDLRIVQSVGNENRVCLRLKFKRLRF